MTSPFFRAGQALKSKPEAASNSKAVATALAEPITPLNTKIAESAAPGAPYHPRQDFGMMGMPYGGFPPYGFGPGPMFPPYPMPYSMSPGWGSSLVQVRNSQNRSSRSLMPNSSSPPPEDMEVSAIEFCNHAGLNSEWAERLDNLGFSIHSNLDDVSREDWLSVGFKALEWAAVKKAFRRVRQELKN